MTESILVTGGSGFVGSNLIPVLSDAGYEVDIFAHSEATSDGLHESVGVCAGDVTDFESIPSFANYDTVVHLAGVVSVQNSVDNPVKTFKTNTLGTQHILERARSDGINNVIYLSSGAVYGNPEYLPIDESHPTECLHPYASSKLAGENVAEAYANTYDLSVATLRGFTLYGPGQDTDNLVPTVVDQITSGNNSISLGNLNPTRDFTYIDDLTSAILTMIEEHQDDYEVYNVGSGYETSVRALVDEIITQSGHDVTVESETAGRDSSIEIERMVADVSYLRQFGWEPEYNIGRGVKATLEQIEHNNG